MANRNGSILDDLALLPWWVNIVLAAIVYLSLKYLIPLFNFRDPVFKGIALAAPGLAPFAAIFLFPAAWSAFNSWRKGRLLEKQKGIASTRSISWHEFEELICECYRRSGYRVTETGGGGADGGVDLVLRKNGEHLLVQCKNWRYDRVGVKVVRELLGVVAAEGATGGIVVSSGTFSQEARDFARGKPLELIEGTVLAKMVEDVKRNPSYPSSSPGPGDSQPKVNACPLCGSAMVLKTARKGPNAGGKFWSCSTYPECSGAKPYTD